MAQHSGKGLLCPRTAQRIFISLIKQHYRPNRRGDVFTYAGRAGIEHAVCGKIIRADERPVPVYNIRTGILLPQRGLRAFAYAAGAAEKHGFTVWRQHIGRMQHKLAIARQNIEHIGGFKYSL
ncbi:MAG: hypothetical protein DBX62_09495 [Clostridia bacterium]|nr:MAG: hypothetical protein DBX62_09495 [Clostridia bacterium]